MKYRIGWPFWKLAYKLGIPMYYRYEILYDVDCKRYIGMSHDIKGLIAECDTTEEVQEVMEDSALDLVNWAVYRTMDVPQSEGIKLSSYYKKGVWVHG